MDNGTDLEVGPGDAAVIAPGDHAWVTSGVPYVMWGIDGDDEDFARPKD